MKLTINNIRSFSGTHHIPIRPLTLLVGENSSGKSTFLAALSAVADSSSFPHAPALNKPPYDLGSYDTIAAYKGGKAGRAKQFGLGFISDTNEAHIEVLAKYTSHRGETRLSEIKLNSPEGQLSLFIKPDRFIGRLVNLDSRIGETIIDHPYKDPHLAVPTVLSMVLLQSLRNLETKAIPMDMLDPIFKLVGRMGEITSTSSIAPIRSKPKRTYDLISEEYDPSGDHIPFVLSKLLEDQKQSSSAETIVDLLDSFGHDSGLFKNLKNKRLGHKEASPFQIFVNVSGPAVNLPDVGYGVSQSLPIIVQSLLESTAPRLLLQQPEVHLHPKAQAALGTFFAHLVKNKKREFVIETHSDYMLDRIRQEVASKKLDHNDVLILFFHKPHIETTVHQIFIDELGNIVGAPSMYREFFLKEDLNLFNRSSICA